ncbi:MAG: MFS transporter [Rhizobacter sp.]
MTTLKTPPPAAWRWAVLVIVSLAMFGNYYVYDSIAPVADALQRLLGFSDTQLGTLNAIYSLPNIVMVLLGGVIVDRFGARLTILAFSIICAIGAVVTAATDQFEVMAAGRLIFGLGAESMIVGWQAGVLVCEDFWHPGLVYALASTGIDVLLVLAAGPGRGVWEGGEHGQFASADAWERIARTTAQLYGIYVALANRAGVEGAVTFAGGSLIVDPAGIVVARAPALEPALLKARLSPADLQRARRPAFHGRDDDPLLVARELRRLHHG